jgi:ribonuclease I
MNSSSGKWIFIVVASTMVASSYAPRSTAWILTLSWLPNYCAQSSTRGDLPECKPKAPPGFVVWNFSGDGRTQGAESFAVSRFDLTRATNDLGSLAPGFPALLRIWNQHGGGHERGLPAASFYSIMGVAARRIVIPPNLIGRSEDLRLSAKELEQAFRRVNVSLPAHALTVRCQNLELESIEFCFDSKLNPSSCSGAAMKCPAQDKLLIRALR